MGMYPHVVVARRDHDFRIVKASEPFPYGSRVKEEGRWLALDWWGNCYVEKFRGAMGHFRSTVEKDVFLVMLVQPGPVAPDRLIVFLREDEYRAFGFNPFRAIQKGLFEFAQPFYAAREESPFHIDWKSRVLRESAVSDEQQRQYDVATQHLMRGTSIIVLTQEDKEELRVEFEHFIHFLSPELLQTINFCTFTNSASEHLKHFGTIVCGWYSMTRTLTLREVLDAFAPPDETGSLFRTIRPGQVEGPSDG
jgi:hypothetical protein